MKPWLYHHSRQRKIIFSFTLPFPLCCLKTNIFAEEAAVSGLSWRKRPDWALQEAVLRKPKPLVTSDLCYRCNICTRERKEEGKKKEGKTLRYSEDGEKTQVYSTCRRRETVKENALLLSRIVHQTRCSGLVWVVRMWEMVICTTTVSLGQQ